MKAPKRRLGMFLVAVAVSCGGTGAANYAGTWTGQVTSPGTSCSDGSKLPASSSDMTASISVDGDALVWDAKCGEVRFTVNGNTAAQVGTRTCAPETVKGAQITRTLKTMTLVLDGTALKVAYTVEAAVALSGKTATCTTSASGTLVKKP